MRCWDQKDLVVALSGAGEAVREKFLRNISDRVRAFLIEEMEEVGPFDPVGRTVRRGRCY